MPYLHLGEFAEAPAVARAWRLDLENWVARRRGARCMEWRKTPTQKLHVIALPWESKTIFKTV